MHALSEADRSFRHAVESCALAPADFNHRAHVRLAYIYLAERDVDAAAEAMRSAILNLLRHYGADSAKFHETLTRAWLLAVQHFMVKAGETSSADDFMEKSAVLLDSKAMLTHYSPELLFSGDARRRFVEPDRDPIPRHDSHAKADAEKERTAADGEAPGRGASRGRRGR